jgi:glutamyl/glutaminyl-tRNA synthetase
MPAIWGGRGLQASRGEKAPLCVIFHRMSMRGRYAPSPTGTIHLGNASTALLSWLSVRAQGGTYVMRIEDLDASRVVAGSSEALLRDLAWLGLDWDEGPDVFGPHAPYVQSERRALYDRAFERLRAAGYLYPCFCSRRDIQGAASAPQAPGDEVLYPGTCRRLEADEAARRIATGRPHAWRFRVDPSDLSGFDDLVCGRFEPAAGATGDFVVRRADGVPAYQLAVVVDDAAMAIDEVVRATSWRRRCGNASCTRRSAPASRGSDMCRWCSGTTGSGFRSGIAASRSPSFAKRETRRRRSSAGSRRSSD